MKTILKKKNTLLFIAAGAMLLVYTLIAVNTVRGEYAISDLEKNIKEATKENGELQLTLSEVSSLDFLFAESERLEYSDVEEVSYIKKPSTSPFASR